MRKGILKVLSVMLVLVLLISVAPISSLATETETATWTKTELADIAATDTVAITMTAGTATYALFNGNGTGSAPTAVAGTVDGTTMTTAGSADTLSWNISAVDGGYVIYPAGSTATWLYSTNSNNGVRVGTGAAKVWAVDGSYLKNIGTDAVRYMGVYLTNPDWRSYTNTTGNIAGQTLGFWKLVPKGTATPEEPAVNTIAEALAGETGASFTVKGVVTLVDGKNIYVQDDTGGICAFFSAKQTEISLGDTITVTGTRAAYNGLPELTGATYEASSGLTLTPAAKAKIADIAAADVCTYISLSGLTVTEVYDNSGAYSAPNITVQDADGATIQIYKAVCGKTDGAWDIAVGDKLNVTCAVGVYNTTYQLRNTIATELTKASSEPEEPVETAIQLVETTAIAAGDKVAIYYPAGTAAISADDYSETVATKRALAAVTQETDGISVLPSENAMFDVAVDADGYYSFSQTGADGAVLYLTSGATGSSLTMAAKPESGKDYSLWTLEEIKDDSENVTGFYIKNVNAVYTKNSVDNPQYLEHYSGFTTYTMTTSAANLKYYTFEFYTEAEQYAVPNGTYVVFNPAYGKALSSTYNGFYNTGADMTLNASGKFDSAAASEVWTVTNNADGSITISCADGKLAMADSYSSTPLNEKNDTWTLEDAGSGLYYIKNAVRATYLEWYASKNNFSTYKTIASGSEGLFAMQFVPATAEPEVPEKPPTGEIADGDYFIYNTTAAGVMRYVTGGGAGVVKATVNEDKTLTLAENSNGAGVYTFKNVSSNKYTIQLGDLYVGAGSGRKLTLNSKADSSCYWLISPVEGGYTMKNESLGYNLEYYSSSGYCLYSMSELSDMFIMNFYSAAGVANTDGYVGTRPPSGDLPLNEGTYLVYNPYGGSVLGPQNDNATAPALAAVGAKLITDAEGKKALEADNGALIFTVKTSVSGGVTYYTFENNGKYLATNENKSDGTNDEHLFLQESLTDCCYWTLEETEGGWVIYNKTASYKGNTVCVEFFSGAFSGWTYKGGTNELFAFQFYPAADTYNTGYVVNPKVVFDDCGEAYKTVKYTQTFSLDDLGEVQSVAYTCQLDGQDISGDALYTRTDNGGEPPASFSVTTVTDGASFGVKVYVVTKVAGQEIKYSGTLTKDIIDEPVILSVKPEAGCQTGEEKQPEISASFANAGDRAAFEMTLDGETVTGSEANGVYAYKPGEALTEGKHIVTFTITRADGKTATKTWFFYIGTADVQLYFGQIHSHTSEYSDGSGTLADAYSYAMNTAKDVDFLIVTDHSNYFDTTSTATKDTIYDASSLTKWTAALATADSYDSLSSDFVCGYGYEMTWSSGPGHINIFNSSGIVSRNCTELNNKTNDAGMFAFYDLIADASAKGKTQNGGTIIGQFNHPGNTFGTFDDFAGWTASRDAIMNLLEVGNGEGAVGSSGYFPSYEYYDMALSLGWHVAPTNNQDNHKGLWGDANTCRDVVLTDNFTEAGIYEALSQRHVYATEDQNLSVTYKLGDALQGDIISGYTAETVNITAEIYDADNGDGIGTVYVIGENGAVLYTSEKVSANSYYLTVELPNSDAYYYVKIVEADGDIAVTAPVWTGEVAATSVSVSASLTDSGSAAVGTADTLNAVLTNNQADAITLTGYTLSIDGKAVKTESGLTTSVAAGESESFTYDWTPESYGSHSVSVTFTATVNGNSMQFTAGKSIYAKGEDYDKVVAVAEAQTGSVGEEFTVEGIVTSNASGFDAGTAFFDCIYIQDSSGGINIFPVDGNFQVGQKVRVHGGITYYNGEIELNISSTYGGYIELLDEALNPVAPTVMTCAESMSDGGIGRLIQVKGTITRLHEVSGVVDGIYVNDGSGTEAFVYINGYIVNSSDRGTGFTGSAPAVGSRITAIGIGSMDAGETGSSYVHRLRVRDRSEIVVMNNDTGSTPEDPGATESPKPTESPEASKEPDALTATDATWIIGSGRDVTMTCTGEADKFESLQIDGKTVDPKNYTVASGSTVVTLKADFVKTLSVGSHKVRFNYTDGRYAESTLTITGTGTGNGPKTGDDSSPVLYATMALLSAALFLYFAKPRRKSRAQGK